MPPPTATEIQNCRLPVRVTFFAHPNPSAKMHGHMRILSTQQTREHSRYYRIFCARHQMHGNLWKYVAVRVDFGCDSNHARPTDEARVWMDAGGSQLLFATPLSV